LKNEQFFFCWFEVPREPFDLTLSVRGENRPNSYKMRQVLDIIPPVPSCLFTMATGWFIQKNMQNKIQTNPEPLNKHNNHPSKHFE